MDKTVEDRNGLHLGKFEKRRPTFIQIYISLYQNASYYVAVISQMKDSCSANMTQKAHN